FLAGKRIFVAPPQKADVARSLQVVQALRISAVLPVEELDGALILVAAIDQQLLALPLRLEGDARHFQIQPDGNRCRQHEYQQQCKTGLAALFHPGNSASSGSVCCVLFPLNCVSSTTAEFTPMRTIL